MDAERWGQQHSKIITTTKQCIILYRASQQLRKAREESNHTIQYDQLKLRAAAGGVRYIVCARVNRWRHFIWQPSITTSIKLRQ